MSKSRGEKGGKTPNANQNAPSITQNAIIPGKLFENDWLHLIDEENGDDFITDIIDEIINTASNKVFTSIITSRVQPYAVLCAKKLLEQVLEVRFIGHDAGETKEDIIESWSEDEEPCAMITDSWAQGAVPVTVSTVTEVDCKDSSDIMIEADNPIVTLESENSNDVNDAASISNSPVDEMNTNETQESNGHVSPTYILMQEQRDVFPDNIALQNHEVLHNDVSHNRDEQKAMVSKIGKKREKKFKPHSGSLPKFEDINLSSVIDVSASDKAKDIGSNDKANDIKTYSMKPRYLLPKDAQFDDNGNLLHVDKINVKKLQPNRVKAIFTVEDPINNASKKIELLTRKNKQLEKHKKLEAEKKLLKKKLLKTEPLLQRLYESSEKINNSLYTPLPPSIVDTIDIQRGVSVREGDLSKQGFHEKMDRGPSGSPIHQKDRLLQSISSNTTKVLKVNDIVSNTSVQNLNGSKPLPSIKT